MSADFSVTLMTVKHPYIAFSLQSLM